MNSSSQPAYTGNIDGVRVEIPKKEFRWNRGTLEQRVEVIQHKASETRNIGVYQEWHPIEVNSSPRRSLAQSGRTTRMLEEAIRLIADHKDVLIVAHDSRQITNLKQRLDQIGANAGLSFTPSESCRVDFIKAASPLFDWKRLQVIEKTRGITVLVDHFAIEATFARLLEMLHRYDPPQP